MYQLDMNDMGYHASGSTSTSEPGPDYEQEETGPIFASIGTVLMDCFDVPPLPSLDTQTPAPTLPPSPTRTSHSTGSTSSTPLSSSSSRSITSSSLSSFTSISSLASLTPKASGSITPQRSFSSDDNTPQTLMTIPCKSSVRGNNTSSEFLNQPISVLGGGALYALVGARIWLPPKECRTLVDTDEGRKDLGKELERELEAYGEGCWGYLEGEGRKMIRARIRYEGTVRLYKHIVPPLPRPFPSLLNTPIDQAKYLHISPPYSPEDVCKLLSERRELEVGGKKVWMPKIVYEPAPLGCHLGQKGYLEEILGGLEVLSPNHEELLSLYGHPLHSLSSPHLRPALEEIITHILNLGIGTDNTGIIAVRCGRLGSVVGTRKGGVRWFPAYWEEEEEGRVKDVTGGGNAYLGGFIAGLSASNGDAYEAALYGTISASFTVEQIGLPRLDTLSPSPPPPRPSSSSSASINNRNRDESVTTESEGGQVPIPRSNLFAQDSQREKTMILRREDVMRERWNGEIPEERLEVFRKRLKDCEVEITLHANELDQSDSE